MIALTPAEIRESLRNGDQRVRRTMLLPRGLPNLDWQQREVLAWRDPRARHRGYLVRVADGRPQGLLLNVATAAGRPDRAVMCSLCRFTARFDEVALMTAPKPSDRGARGDSVGILVCEDLACHLRLRARPAPGPLDPPAEEIIAARIAGFTRRVDDFFRVVLDPGLRSRSRSSP